MLTSIILGLIQGLTEFLPVSSSGHLTIAQHFLDISEYLVAMDVCFHMGTLLAVCVYFFQDIIQILKDKEYVFKILIVTLVTAVVAVLAKDLLESFFHKVVMVMVMLIGNGIVLLTTKNRKTAGKNISYKQAALIGLAQCLAIIPGISRSGITISTMLHLNIDREEAFRFSFIMSIPVIFGAFLFKIKDIYAYAGANTAEMIMGTLIAFLSGLLSLKVLKYFMDSKKMYLFGYYCICVGVVLLWFTIKVS